MDRRRGVRRRRTGAGVTVAIIDSGVEPDHPAVGGRLVRSLRVEAGRRRPARRGRPGRRRTWSGHGTACAGIIHAIAPAADLVSIRVLGADNRGAGPAFAAALEWAIGEGFGVVNLSLSSRSEAMAERFHELADEAYFANTLLVAAANNVTGSVVPVAVRRGRVGGRARRRRIRTCGSTTRRRRSSSAPTASTSTSPGAAARGSGRPGNSFAAPHLAGRAALIRAAHPDASPFEVKTILAATADDPRT